MRAAPARRAQPEARVVLEVGVPLHRHHPPRGPPSHVSPPGGQVVVRRVARGRGLLGVWRQVESDHGVVRVDLAAVTSTEQAATGAHDGAAAVAADRRVAQSAQHTQRRVGRWRPAECAEAVRRVVLAQLTLVGVLHQSRCRAGRRSSAHASPCPRLPAAVIRVFEVARSVWQWHSKLDTARASRLRTRRDSFANTAPRDT